VVSVYSSGQTDPQALAWPGPAATADPGGTDAGCHIDLLISDMARSIAVDEADLIGHAQLHRSALGLCGE